MIPPCVVPIAQYYNVPAPLIRAVAHIESKGKNPGRIGPNRDGSYDIGIMQINTWWFQKDGKYSLSSMGITEQELLNNNCTNIAVGTWILSQNLSQYGDTKAALAAYNTGHPRSKVGLNYATKVLRRMKYEQLTASNN